jgi:hypothetical protein
LHVTLHDENPLMIKFYSDDAVLTRVYKTIWLDSGVDSFTTMMPRMYRETDIKGGLGKFVDVLCFNVCVSKSKNAADINR